MRGWILPLVISLGLLGCDEKKGGEAQQPEPIQPPAEGAAKPDEAKPGEPAAAGTEQPAEPAAAKADDPAHQLLDAAIAARGGLEKLKAASQWTAKSKGVYMGEKYQAVSYYQPVKMRMDVLDPQGNPGMSMFWSLDDCWNKMGPVVMPCDEDAKTETKRMMAMHRAFELYPLQEAGWELEAGKEKVGEKELDALKVKNADLGADGTLYIDPESKQVTRMRYQGSMMKMEGEFVMDMKDHQEHCGIPMPVKTATTFAGKPYMTEEVTEVTCEAPDAQVFEKPEQVADGTFVQKTTTPMVVACTNHKGPYEKMNDTIGKLMGFVEKQKMAPMGPPCMTYLKGPPKVKKPKKFVTEICLPVATKAPKRPKKKGKFVVKSVKPMDVLAVYGIGDYNTKSGELMKALMQEVKKRKLKPKGPVTQIGYMKPGEVPAEELVSEMMIPIKGGKQPAKKGKKKAK